MSNEKHDPLSNPLVYQQRAAEAFVAGIGTMASTIDRVYLKDLAGKVE